MDLRQLRYFVAVAEERHITRAAERLGMQQPPLSQQIKAIEQELDVAAVPSQGAWGRATDAGRSFLTGARDPRAPRPRPPADAADGQRRAGPALCRDRADSALPPVRAASDPRVPRGLPARVHDAGGVSQHGRPSSGSAASRSTLPSCGRRSRTSQGLTVHLLLEEPMVVRTSELARTRRAAIPEASRFPYALWPRKPSSSSGAARAGDHGREPSGMPSSRLQSSSRPAGASDRVDTGPRLGRTWGRLVPASIRRVQVDRVVYRRLLPRERLSGPEPRTASG